MVRSQNDLSGLCWHSYIEFDDGKRRAGYGCSLSLFVRPWASPDREYSGAAFYKDRVILLPQYPERCDDKVPSFSVSDLLAAKDEESLSPSFIKFNDAGLPDVIDGFEGFEALAFTGDDVFVTVESRREDRMMGFLVRGKIQQDPDEEPGIALDASTRVALLPRATLGNMSDEAIVVLPAGKLLTFYEANGLNVVPAPTAYLFDVTGPSIRKVADVPMPHIEYRITDCTPADASGYFWCINFMWPGDEKKLQPAADDFGSLWKDRASDSEAWRSGNHRVERLVQLRFDGKEITAGKEAPINFKTRDLLARNWEGLAYLPERGFFVATDKFPRTLFAFLSKGK